MSTRSFKWCRQELAQECQEQGHHGHIVINSPGGRFIWPACKKLTLHLFFHDLDPEAIRRTKAAEGNWPKAQEMIDNCFSEDNAKAIIKFVETLYPHDIIVNCEAGISRSPGVVLALRRKYGGDTEEVFKECHPNIHVVSVLGKALGVSPFKMPDYSVEDFFSKFPPTMPPPLEKSSNPKCGSCSIEMVFDNRDFQAHSWVCPSCSGKMKCDHQCCGGNRK